MKILAQRPTHISAVATDRKREGVFVCVCGGGGVGVEGGVKYVKADNDKHYIWAI